MEESNGDGDEGANIHNRAAALILGGKAPIPINNNPFISPVKKAPTLRRIGGYQKNALSNSHMKSK